ncbi:hypothetical protein [Halarcobacter ebronensis]|uniref:Uncharacterized protein n=1 Tax=Halarcobacter ebronensis TaxID=1462615 RepID=A0A4Q1ANN1_9BACT|nr:hypothetical protein [Halarcobacter ebronensis]QKF83389.1 hypothetical protein AEBR_2938 [Halarcobacter ebronensis]RXK05949.1 hypothetical protein CRV07_07710 [Halarcobacter ebronensis]
MKKNMKMPLSTFLTQNRIEEKGDDLWGIYVLPINYKSLLHYKKSNHIRGGRGSGKTAFLKYHCYPTLFSKKKKRIDQDILENIGIYFKPDSRLLSDMSECSLDKAWRPVINAYIGLSIISELSNFLITFLDSSYENSDVKKQVQNLIVPLYLLKPFNINEKINFVEINEHLREVRVLLNNWLSYTDSSIPYIIDAKTMISEYIDLIRQIEVFKNTTFFVFLDEFENFSYEQQVLINTWMKNVENGIIYNVTYKKHYEPTYDLFGDEKLQERNDYRVIDIDKDVIVNENNFKLLCCEIIINSLQFYYNNKYEFLEKFDVNYLSSENYLNLRKEKVYQENIISVVEKILPLYDLKRVAQCLMEDNGLSNKVKKSIENSLKSSNKKVSDFFSENHTDTILNAILLNRETLNIDEIYDHFKGNTEKYKHWKNINLLGAILFFYNKYTYKICPYYGGLDRFVKQSCNNVRHFIELFHKSIIELENNDISFSSMKNISIPVELQASAAKNVSTYEFDRKISSSGNKGFSLKTIAGRLGQLFQIRQNDPAQSIAEVNEFSIQYKQTSKDPKEQSRTEFESLLKELNMWSILVEKDITKVEDKTEQGSLKEYRLHPIFSSYFGISPRQKRKIVFSIRDIKSIFDTQNELEFEKIKKRILNYDDKNDNNSHKKEKTLLDLLNEY